MFTFSEEGLRALLVEAYSRGMSGSPGNGAHYIKKLAEDYADSVINGILADMMTEDRS